MPPDELELLAPHLEEMALEVRQDLYEAGRRVEHVCFLHQGVASLTTTMQGGTTVGSATAGPEGMVRLPVLLGADRMASTAFIQMPGEGVRIEAETFRQCIQRCPTLRGPLLRYILALMNLMARN